ncbi:hypothetical protein ACS0TY_015708 [Phlomoides rotata]
MVDKLEVNQMTPRKRARTNEMQKEQHQKLGIQHKPTIVQSNLLILDINELSTYIVFGRNYDWAYKPNIKFGNYSVFLRPHFKEFIDFCFENFEVAL